MNIDIETQQETYPGINNQARRLNENIIRSLTNNDEYVQEILQELGDLTASFYKSDKGEIITNDDGKPMKIMLLGPNALVNKKGFKNILLKLKAINKDIGLGFRHYNEIEKELRFDVTDFLCSVKENHSTCNVSPGDIRTIISMYDKILSAMLYKSYRGQGMKSVTGVAQTRETIKNADGKGGKGLFSKFKKVE